MKLALILTFIEFDCTVFIFYFRFYSAISDDDSQTDDDAQPPVQFSQPYPERFKGTPVTASSDTNESLRVFDNLQDISLAYNSPLVPQHPTKLLEEGNIITPIVNQKPFLASNNQVYILIANIIVTTLAPSI